ncbi:13189_t:CDS:2, partial [Funneliformis caledonium]
MLSDKILDEVRYANYWRRPLTEWGIETWDKFFFEEIQKSTKKSHQAFESCESINEHSNYATPHFCEYGEEERPDFPSIPKDITTEIIKLLVQCPGQLPKRSNIADFLNENPPVKIPLAPIHFFQLKTRGSDCITEEERNIYFVPNAKEECTSLFSKLLGQLIYPPSYGKNEDSYHSLWDSIIKNTIEVFGKHNASLQLLEFDRNTSKKTATGCNRPDMVVKVRNVCLFRGEEKCPEGVGDPSKELTEKIKGWEYGDAPYIFGYYAVGTFVTFVTMHKPITKSNNKRKQSVYSKRIAEFDLGRLSDRIRIMNFLRNVLSFSADLHNNFPSKRPTASNALKKCLE